MDRNLYPAPSRSQPDSNGANAGLALPEPRLGAGRLYLLIAPRPAVDRLMDALAVRLALAAAGRPGVESHQPYLHILDGGNRFDLHAIARGLSNGLAGGSVLVEAALQSIRVARAFTCYQMEALLAEVADCRGGSAPIEANGFGECRPAVRAGLHPQILSGKHMPRPAPTESAPVLALGLLTTFADENVRLGERLRVLQRCLQDLKCLARGAPVLVSVTQPPAGADAAGFLPHLEAASDQIWRFETQAAGRSRSAAIPGQLRLF
jgi:hypothetical protein